MKGKIIVIEGTDCSGKETQSKLLEEKLKNEGNKVLRISFPVYDSPTGKIIGGAYLGKKEIGETYFKEGPINVDPKVISMYYAADRLYNMKDINKYIDEGYYIILDRYTTSNLAHQGSKIIDKDERFIMYDWIDKLEYWLLGLPKPDITIFLHVPYNIVKQLKENRNSLDEHEKDEDYIKRSIDAYIELSELYNWNKIECVKDNKLRSIEDINKEIIDIIKKM